MERINNDFVIENLPIRYNRKKITKYSPSTATTDFDLVAINSNKPGIVNICECKSNINSTFHNKSRDRILKQIKEVKKLAKTRWKGKQIKQTIFGINIANRIKNKIPRNVEIIEGELLESNVLDKLILHIGEDPRIDPKDDVLSLIRLFWHFGLLNEKYYEIRAREIYLKQKKITPNQLRSKLGLISYKTSYCKSILNKI
jgi:hypothetical protein